MEDRRGIGANCGLYVNNLRAQVNLAGCHLATDILCSFEVLYFCGFDSIKSPAHVVINTSCLNVSRSLQAFVASRYNFERLSIRGRPKPKHVHVTTEVSDRCITSCDTEQGNTFTSPWPLT